MKTKDNITKTIKDHLTAAETLFDLTDDIEMAAELLIKVIKSGNTIFWIGNGGSAADCQHLAAEFVGRFNRPDNPLPSIALTTDSSVITSIGNDVGFDVIFSTQIQALCRPGDLVIGISTSGYSKNVELGLHEANSKTIHTIALVGNNGGNISSLADVAIIVPVENTARIQECHITIGHILCEIIDNET